MAAPTLDKDVPHLEDLQFHGSKAATLGVELELQIIDRETGDLAPGAVRLLQMAEEEKVAGVAAELMQSMLEVKTGICQDVVQVRDELVPVLRRVRNMASSVGLDLALGGTHPFHRATASAVFPADRYERIVERLAWLTYQRVVFGLHIHVGVPEGDLALGVMGLMTRYLPHLLALSANSAFWQGIDTGLSSARAALYGLLPHSGVPPHFNRWKDFRTYCQVMRDCQAGSSFKDIYWDIRPRPDFGTIEFRICDMPPSLAMTLAIVALTRSLVVSNLQLLKEKPHLRRGDMRRHWIASENKWLATRYGMGAMYIRTPGGKRRQLVQDLAELVDKMTPLARQSGDYAFFGPLQKLDHFESGAGRQRRFFRETGNWKGVIEQQVRDLGKELESAPAAAPAPQADWVV